MARRFHRFFIIIIISVCPVTSLLSQSGDILDILYSGPEDASRYADKYFEPIFKGLGYGFNNGWYNTAKTHRTLGFDITISANLAFVPDVDNYFTFRNEEFLVTELETGTEARTPTLFGPDEAGPIMEVKDEITGLTIARFAGPRGAGFEDELGFQAVPSPIIQVGIGVIKNTDIKVRYIPDVAREDADYSVWGVGIMHDIGQWIPVIKNAPIDLSLFGAYSRLSTTIRFDPLEEFPGVNQRISSSISGYTLEALISKKISVITLLAGFGYNSAKTNFDVLGTYNVTYGNPALPEDYTIDYEDPIKLDTNESSARLTGGVRFQFAVITLHALYTFNGYNLLNVGLGFSFR
jgi:hypothetical protein